MVNDRAALGEEEAQGHANQDDRGRVWRQRQHQGAFGYHLQVMTLLAVAMLGGIIICLTAAMWIAILWSFDGGDPPEEDGK